MDQSPLALPAMKESFFVFAGSSFALVFFGSFFIDLRTNLPATFESLITEPVSLNTFAFLVVVGMTLLALVTKFGTNDYSKFPKTAYVALAFIRAGLSAGAIAAGSMVGLSVSLVIITRGAQGTPLANTAEQFPWITLNVIGLVYPMYLMAEMLLDPQDKKKLRLGILTAVYLVIALATFFFARNNLKIAGFVLLIFCAAAYGLLHKSGPNDG